MSSKGCTIGRATRGSKLREHLDDFPTRVLANNCLSREFFTGDSIKIYLVTIWRKFGPGLLV
jgi:hypothetical protein